MANNNETITIDGGPYPLARLTDDQLENLAYDAEVSDADKRKICRELDRRNEEA